MERFLSNGKVFVIWGLGRTLYTHPILLQKYCDQKVTPKAAMMGIKLFSWCHKHTNPKTAWFTGIMSWCGRVGPEDCVTQHNPIKQRQCYRTWLNHSSKLCVKSGETYNTVSIKVFCDLWVSCQLKSPGPICLICWQTAVHPSCVWNITQIGILVSFPLQQPFRIMCTVALSFQ